MLPASVSAYEDQTYSDSRILNSSDSSTVMTNCHIVPSSCTLQMVDFLLTSQMKRILHSHDAVLKLLKLIHYGKYC